MTSTEGEGGEALSHLPVGGCTRVQSVGQRVLAASASL
jgi:hypothetical protein